MASDVLTPKQITRNMSASKGKNSRLELKLRQTLLKLGFRYRTHHSGLSGKPDVV